MTTKMTRYTRDLVNYHFNTKILSAGIIVSFLSCVTLMIIALKIKPKDDNSNADYIKSTKTKLWIGFVCFLVLLIIFCFGLYKYSSYYPNTMDYSI